MRFITFLLNSAQKATGAAAAAAAAAGADSDGDAAGADDLATPRQPLGVAAVDGAQQSDDGRRRRRRLGRRQPVLALRPRPGQATRTLAAGDAIDASNYQLDWISYQVQSYKFNGDSMAANLYRRDNISIYGSASFFYFLKEIC